MLLAHELAHVVQQGGAPRLRVNVKAGARWEAAADPLSHETQAETADPQATPKERPSALVLQRQSAVDPGRQDPTDATPAQKGPSREELFCYKCPKQTTPKVAIYKQWDSEFVQDNILFARIFLLNHNVNLNVDPAAGVIPPMYDEESQRFSKVERVDHLCDIVRDLEKQGTLPPPSGTLPALFLPFGKQLATDAADTVGWHIPDINANCRDLVGELGTSTVLLVDSNPERKSCAKVLLHEISHAVGNGDVPDAPMIMGPCDPSLSQDAPIGCDPDRTENLMTASEVKKFCKS
jgi:hypothetical protein